MPRGYRNTPPSPTTGTAAGRAERALYFRRLADLARPKKANGVAVEAGA